MAEDDYYLCNNYNCFKKTFYDKDIDYNVIGCMAILCNDCSKEKEVIIVNRFRDISLDESLRERIKDLEEEVKDLREFIGCLSNLACDMSINYHQRKKILGKIREDKCG